MGQLDAKNDTKQSPAQGDHYRLPPELVNALRAQLDSQSLPEQKK